jgi:N-acetylmuramoyl-L-alanine amidase
MAKCPFATWRPISGSSGPHMDGPFKIVHHTTEGSTAAGALATFAKNRSDPHFTVDAQSIFQHIDTAEGARALRNDPGGVQTNRDSAVQIELVGFAHLPKNRAALTNLARLCRWIETTHAVPQVWPAGKPKPAKNGKDPGGHNRNPQIWDSQSGHYGHCHVPENTHWDPAYSAEEADFILRARFGAQGQLLTPVLPALPAMTLAQAVPAGARGAGAATSARKTAPAPRSTMPDHGQVAQAAAAATKKRVVGGPLTVAQARALAKTSLRPGPTAPAAAKAPASRAAAPQRASKTAAKTAVRLATPLATPTAAPKATLASVQTQQRRLAIAQRTDMRERLREYKATLALLKARGTQGLSAASTKAQPAKAQRSRAAKTVPAAAAGGASAADSSPLRVLAEGDSWFDYPVPFFGGGVIPRLENRLGVPIFSLAQAGDETRFMLGVQARKELTRQLIDGCPDGGPWDLLLFSGGGNDIVDNPLSLWLADFEATKPPADLLRAERFAAALALVRAAYEDLIELRNRLSPHTRLVFHGYDFPIPDNRSICGRGPWLRPAFDLHGFPPDMAASRAVIKSMLEQFAAMLQSLATNPGVSVVLTQGTLAPVVGSWHNEMHPSKAGFERISEVFHVHLKALFPGRVLA